MGKYEYERGQDQLEEKEEDTVEKSPVLVIPAFHAVGSLGDSENIEQLINYQLSFFFKGKTFEKQYYYKLDFTLSL